MGPQVKRLREGPPERALLFVSGAKMGREELRGTSRGKIKVGATPTSPSDGSLPAKPN